MNRISGPLLDRIDLQIEVTPVAFDELNQKILSESSDNIRTRVTKTREIQRLRYHQKESIHTNAQMGSGDVSAYCGLQEDTIKLLKEAMKRLGLSARAYNRILKVARTIADMEQSENIRTEHVSEAIQYRTLDRLNWTIN